MSSDLATNRKAFHDYEILETHEAGIVLVGTEIKSLRENGASLQEAFIQPLDGALWLYNCTIAAYKFGNVHNHEERRSRKLLMHKKEILKLSQAVREKGLTLIALALYLKKGLCKVKIALARGKKSHDKRHALREKEEKRRIQRLK
jgi:SsrA-binding protein